MAGRPDLFHAVLMSGPGGSGRVGPLAIYTLHQQGHGPTKVLQSLGGGQTRQSDHPGPIQDQLEQAHVHTDYKNVVQD